MEAVRSDALKAEVTGVYHDYLRTCSNAKYPVLHRTCFTSSSSVKLTVPFPISFSRVKEDMTYDHDRSATEARMGETLTEHDQ